MDREANVPEPCVVFVQIKNDLPQHVWHVFRQARRLWAGDIYLIAPKRESAYVELERLNIKFVPCETLEQSQSIKDYEKITLFEKMHPGWDGFWDYACKRFFYLAEFMKIFYGPVLYIENDVVVYEDVEKLFNYFKTNYRYKMTFIQHTINQLSCCFSYIGSQSALNIFCNSIKEYFLKGEQWIRDQIGQKEILNETHLAFLAQRNPIAFELLPNLPGDVEYVFDPMAYGQWINGRTHDLGKPYAHESHIVGNELLKRNLEIAWKFFEGYKYPFVYNGEELYKLATLHFNGKIGLEKWI